MSAKIQWRKEAWWVITHWSGKRMKRRYGPTKEHHRIAQGVALRINAQLADGTFDPKQLRAETRPPSPLFREFAKRYLVEDTAHLNSTTRSDRPRYLRKDGPLDRFLADRRLDEITPALLREWWNAEVIGRELSTKTGRKYLDVLAAIIAYAIDLGLLEASPLPAFREQIRRRARTQQGRAESAPDRNVRPIERPAELRRLVEAAEEHALDAYARTHEVQKGAATRRALSLEERCSGARDCLAVLLMLDAGLRVGEVAGLTWGQIRWGADEEDPARALHIDRSRPRGGEEGPPKSGRARTVALSRRLRTALAELHRLQFRPGPEKLALPGFDPPNFHHRGWRKILDRAQIGHRSPKDLRDTYASWLLSLGVQLGYISRQLGHADVATTAEHYARWCGGDAYRDAMRLEPGDVPADLLARVIEEASIEDGPRRPQTAPGELDSDAALVSPRNLERETGVEPATLSLGS
jgi:integrase